VPIDSPVSRAFTFSHSRHLPPSPSAPQPRARRYSYSGAQINAIRAQPDVQPDANHTRHEGEMSTALLRRAIMHKPTLDSAILLLLRLLLRSAPLRPAGRVSVDLRSVFSHGHLRVRVRELQRSVSGERE
jgi:hypothetical protein